MAQGGEALCRIAGSNATLILMKGDIKHPMDAVLNAPMTPHSLTTGTGGQWSRE